MFLRTILGLGKFVSLWLTKFEPVQQKRKPVDDGAI